MVNLMIHANGITNLMESIQVGYGNISRINSTVLSAHTKSVFYDTTEIVQIVQFKGKECLWHELLCF